MSLKANILANFVGQGWRALISLGMVPLYIHFLGIEAYGIIGLFATLQAGLGLLDVGLRPVLGREMARFTSGARDSQSIADLLRSAEIIALAIASAFVVIVWAASGWLSSDWVQGERIPEVVVSQSFILMGAVAALQFVESLYSSALSGLQRQVMQNGIMIFIVTLRAAGAVGVLMWVSPTLQAFFIWQGITSLISVTLFAWAVYATLPNAGRLARFSWDAVREVRVYAAGMIGITLLSVLLMQIDKILLSQTLPLEKLAHYLLAGLVAGSMSILTAPVSAAYFPRLTELASRGDKARLIVAFHQAAQLTTLPLAVAATMLILFGDRLLVVWTNDPVLSQRVAPLLSVVAIGTMFNGLMNVPFRLQLAYGWTSLSIKINCAAVAILVPAMLLIIPYFGAMGAAWIWATLNIAYVLIGAQLMFVRLIKSEKQTWYFRDIGLPIAAAGIVGLIMRQLLPVDGRTLPDVASLAVAAFFIGAATMLSSSMVVDLVRKRLLSL